MTQTWLLHPSFVRDSMATEARTNLAVWHLCSPEFNAAALLICSTAQYWTMKLCATAPNTAPKVNTFIKSGLCFASGQRLPSNLDLACKTAFGSFQSPNVSSTHSRILSRHV